MNSFTKIFIGLFGILLPLATLLVEATTGLSGAEYFDPIPSIPHFLAVAFVPAANALVFLFILRTNKIPPHICGYISACALFVSLIYAIPYLPILPIAIPATLFYGIGLLPLAPLFAFLSAVLLRRALKQRNVLNQNSRVPGLGKAFFTVLALFIALEFQPILTSVGMKLAHSKNPSTSQRGIDILRTIGNEETMLGACYGRRGRGMEPFSAMFGWTISAPLGQDDARDLFFRVTGKAYNTLPIPASLRGRAGFFWRSDADQGTRNIGNIITDLKLTSSNFAGSVDATAAVAYTEWTLTFKNSTFMQQEARSQISLPAGSVVSRLTLWINGEEREAAFAGRGKVEQAYRQVVSQRRDPVLVTTDGPNRVLLQLFPIPASGGTMKVRLGITSPLELDGNGKPTYRLPQFNERNFEIEDALVHDLWIDSEANSALNFWQLATHRNREGKYSVKGGISTNDMGSGAITFEAVPASVTSYTADYKSDSQEQIIQRFERVPAPAPKEILAVIDASSPIAAHRDTIETALRAAKGRANLSVYLATDMSQKAKFIGPKVIVADSQDFQEELRDALQAASYVGGQDDTPALIRAIDDAQEKPMSAIFWFHGTQYLESLDQESFNQRLVRSQILPTIYEVEFERGKNSVVRSLERQQILERAPTEKAALAGFMEELLSANSRSRLVRVKVPSESTPQGSSHKTSSHLAKLWAAEEVKRMIREKTGGDLNAATLLAAAYNIVTPVTGAVVLETQAQYEAAGLDPANPLEPNTVPTIPEPETYLMMLIAGSFLLVAFKKQREAEC